MQIDLLPTLPPSGEYENVLTVIDVSSRYIFAYSLTDASAINVAKVIIDIMTKHAYLLTTLITDKGTAFKSTIIAEFIKILGITLECATTKHPQTIGKLERTHASLERNLKMTCEEFRQQMMKICRSKFSIITQATTPVSVVNQQDDFMEEFLTKSWIASMEIIQMSRSHLQPNLRKKSKIGKTPN